MYFHPLVAVLALLSFKVDGLSVDNRESNSFNASSVGPLEDSTTVIATSPKSWKILKIQPKVDIETSTELEKGESQVDSVDKSKYNKSTLANQGSSKDKLSSWNSRWSKLPIRPPKLRFGDKPIPTKSRRIAYGSVVRTRSLDKSEARLVPMEYKNSSKSSTQDILQLSSSEKFSSSLRLTRFNVDSSDSKSSKLSIPNLLTPKFPRPAMYSLNGYIPKPNIQRLSTTLSPSVTKPPSGRSMGRSHSIYSRNEFLNDKHGGKDNEKFNVKKYGSKHEQFLDDSTDLTISGTVNHQLSKRRGYLTTLKSVGSKQQSTNESPQQQKYRLTKRKGEPGKDFPLIKSIPRTSFECKDQTSQSAYYADVETDCQVWHMCQGHRKHSFLCPRGTIFSQKSGVCDWWYNVDCQGVADYSVVTDKKHDSVTKGNEMDKIRTKLSKNGKNIFESILSGKRRFY
ncbi:uncharacterized protein LOC107371987 [Tetranychus urticae]|uniref:Chitin-binding type-2 domain-containing protein n=1 Tax=Tetranychus urticae TaxID=32264 RepID=T1JYU5_TETUR|nr:uncharacterized protein LOC107371987 [Tetranychus urticae]